MTEFEPTTDGNWRQTKLDQILLNGNNVCMMVGHTVGAHFWSIKGVPVLSLFLVSKLMFEHRFQEVKGLYPRMRHREYLLRKQSRHRWNVGWRWK